MEFSLTKRKTPVKLSFTLYLYTATASKLATTHLLPHEQLDRLAKIDPEIEAAIKQSPQFANPAQEIPDPVKYVQDTRAAYAQMAMAPQDEAVTETKSSYQSRDGTTLGLKIYKAAHAAPDQPSPVLVWYHGGGFCIGTPEINTAMYRQLVKTYNSTIIAPTYRLAPENKWPTPINDAWDAFVHITTHFTTFSPSPQPSFLIGGESTRRIETVLSLPHRRTLPRRTLSQLGIKAGF